MRVKCNMAFESTISKKPYYRKLDLDGPRQAQKLDLKIANLAHSSLFRQWWLVIPMQVTIAQWITDWLCNLRVRVQIPLQTDIFYFSFYDMKYQAKNNIFVRFSPFLTIFYHSQLVSDCSNDFKIQSRIFPA